MKYATVFRYEKNPEHACACRGLVECYYCKGVHSVHFPLLRSSYQASVLNLNIAGQVFDYIWCKVTFFRSVDNLTNVVDPHRNKRAFQPLAIRNIA